MTGGPVVVNAPWAWMRANDLPNDIPDDADLHVDETAGTITVEVTARDGDGAVMTHARKHIMTRVATFPLKVPPPPGLLDAYHHTVAKIRRERSVVEHLRAETVREVWLHLRRQAEVLALTDTALGGFLAGVATGVWQRYAAGPEPTRPPLPAGGQCGGGCPT